MANAETYVDATSETIADIIAEMRGIRVREFQDYADRLEAAHKREVEATAAKCCQLGRLAGYGASEIKHQQEPVGDAAKLREALESIANNIERRLFTRYPSSATDEWMLRKAREALSAPPRNCDMGTAEDWLSRFNTVCERCSGSDCDHRLFKDEEVCDCFARWLQMPYKEGGAK